MCKICRREKKKQRTTETMYVYVLTSENNFHRDFSLGKINRIHFINKYGS